MPTVDNTFIFATSSRNITLQLYSIVYQITVHTHTIEARCKFWPQRLLLIYPAILNYDTVSEQAASANSHFLSRAAQSRQLYVNSDWLSQWQ